MAARLALLVGRELRRRRAVEAELAQLSCTDPRTGLPNRRVVDADHFKRYNDRHGHAVGDLVLRSPARALSAALRRPSDLVARIGGEEYAMEGTACVAERAHEAVSGVRVEAQGRSVVWITVSIGLGFGLPRQGGHAG